MSKWQWAADQLIKESGVTVRKWRNTNSGTAYTSSNDWGIEAPRPRGPVSFCVFAHEVGHQVLHRKNGKKPRWIEEVEAHEYALTQLERFELPGREKAIQAAVRDIDYSFGKALRRGVPLETIQERFPEWAERIWQNTVAEAAS